MSRFKALMAMLIILTLLVGCETASPMPTPTPPASPAPATPVPPTATAIPPTPVPTALPGALTVAVPPGNPPTLDGTVSPGEWDSARREKLSDGSELLLMQNGGYLYLGIRARMHSIWSVCLDRGDEIAVLHSSGALGTAVYKRAGSGWQQTRTFDWTLQDTSNSETARQQRKQFLEQEGWLASLGTMGKPEKAEVEFQLAMPQGSLRLAVAFPSPPSFDKAAVWPVGLDDDVRNIKLLEGDDLAQLQFSPERWAVVTVATATGAGSPPTPVPTALPGALTVAVPPGNPPTLDGTVSPGEWDSARREKLSDGSELLLMQNGGYLYLGIQAHIQGVSVWSVYLDRGDGIAVLHSSAALGTAAYKRAESGWQRTRTFDWTLRDTSNSETARQQRKQFLEQEGWLASLGTMGKPEEAEFQLAMPQGSLRLAVAFLLPPNFDKAAWWPIGLDDDVRNIDLLRGDAPAQLRFSPERWAVVTVATATGAGSPVNSRWARSYTSGYRLAWRP